MPFEKPKAIILKILGVTTSWKFAREDLVKYVPPNTKDYLDRHWGEESLKAIIAGLEATSAKEKSEGKDCPEVKGNNEQLKKSIVDYVNWATAAGPPKPNTALNDLQGYIWGEGFRKGAIKAHLYPDVNKAVKEWKAQGIKVYTFSTGSVEGQQAYFANSIHGDLSRLIDGHISARSAHLDKFETGCYAKIAQIVMEDRTQILFLTNSSAEAKAAVLAGIKAVLVIREGNMEAIDAEDSKHFVNIKDFTQLKFTD